MSTKVPIWTYMIRPQTLLVSLLISSLWYGTSIQAIEAPPELSEFEAVYAIQWRGLPAGSAVHRLRKIDNQHYTFDTQTDPLIPLLPYRYHESTQYIWQGQTIRPQHFHYQYVEGKKHKQGTIVFDWLTRQLSTSAEGDPWPVTLKPGVQDKLTHSLMLRYDLKHHRAQSYSYQVASDDTVRTYHFEVLEEVSLDTALGSMQTVHLKHVSAKGRETHIWFAKKLDYLPVRLIQYRNGSLQTEALIKKYDK